MHIAKVQYLATITAIFTIAFAINYYRMKNTKDELNIAYPVYWGSIVPPLQHTAAGDEIQLNQFEPLVTIGLSGEIEPLAAKSWTISDDQKTFTFTIDRSKKFSDGTQLSAKHFVASWLAGLKLDPKSSNSSIQDILYRVVGFKDFSKNSSISGLAARDDDTLTITFSEPFRMALDHLSGGRFAAYILKDGQYIGTGPYVIVEDSSNKKLLKLSQNPFWHGDVGFKKANISVVPPNEALDKIPTGEVDVYMFAERGAVRNNPPEVVGFLDSYEASHVALYLNGMADRFFKSTHLRLAAQSILAKCIPNFKLPLNLPESIFRFDLQTFLPIQNGRLEDSKVREIIASGEKYEDELIEGSKKRPLYFLSVGNNWVMDALKSRGVHFTENSGDIDFSDWLRIYYKEFTPDMMVGNFSVVMGDPDGIHHILGKDGAITSPIIYRSEVAKLIEDGRSILHREELNSHYQKVSIEILRQVPYVHLGFRAGKVAFNKEKISLNTIGSSRKEPRIQFFYPK